jgi:Cytochrome P460
MAETQEVREPGDNCRRLSLLLFLPLCSLLIAGCSAAEEQPTLSDGPRYLNGTSLVRPMDYREWTFIGSALGLAYEAETASPDAPPTFTNVFVNPSSHRAFMETGGWPSGTVFVLEFRRSQTDAAPNQGGRFQGELFGLEAEVKDSRFSDGWAFFSFGRDTDLTEVAAPLSGDAAARCVQCHTEETAVERTFVQFYPTLLEVARQKGTLKPGF